MCTVAYLPSAGEVLLASNRDEQTNRLPAAQPAVHTVGGKQLLFPRDGQAGGSWIAVHENGGAAVLFNGAFEKHLPATTYRASRGLVFLDLVGDGFFQDNYERYNLEQIEPFSIVFVQEGRLWENRWDGYRKHSRQLDATTPHFWASATLYTPAQRLEKQQQFHDWRLLHAAPGAEDLLHFQLSQQLLDSRPLLQTVSATCIALQKNKAAMLYTDLRTGSRSTTEMAFDYQLAPGL